MARWSSRHNDSSCAGTVNSGRQSPRAEALGPRSAHYRKGNHLGAGSRLRSRDNSFRRKIGFFSAGVSLMKLSARNVLPATVKKVTPGAVDSEVIVELAPGIEIVAIITKQAAETLALKSGAKAYAIIKASNVMIG